MNDPLNIAHRSSEFEALQSRFALRVAARLSERAQLAPHDVNARLRFAREQALERGRAMRSAAEVPLMNGSTMSLLGGQGFSSSWWMKLAAVVPLIALVAGLVLIQNQHDQAQITTAAEIDADLLSDVLPPAAYSDVGFVEFLKAPSD